MNISKGQILEERCNNYRNMFKDLCETYKLDRYKIASDYNEAGFLTVNDARYLVGLCDIEDSNAFNKAEKSPVAVLPREKWDKKRSDELLNGIRDYIAAGKLPPIEWLEEHIEILGRMEKTNE